MKGLERTTSFYVVTFVVILVVLGCQEAPYKLAPVRGRVTVDGQPFANARVMFAPTSQGGKDAGKPAFGTVSSDGSFALTTYREGDGAIVGEHWVTVFPPADESAAVKLPKFRRFTVRQKHPIAAEQENQIELELNSEEIARFAAK